MQNRKNYPENWNDEIRPSILKRDNYKCCHCGIKHRQYLLHSWDGSFMRIDNDEAIEMQILKEKVSRVYLQVAHLDNNTQNNSPGNLLTLCPRCHLKMDRRYSILKRIGNLIR